MEDAFLEDFFLEDDDLDIVAVLELLGGFLVGGPYLTNFPRIVISHQNEDEELSWGVERGLQPA